MASRTAPVRLIGIALGADDDPTEGARRLREGEVEFGAGGTVEGGILHIGDDADDGPPGRVAAGSADPMAEGALAGPVGFGHGLIDHDGERSAGAIGFVEESAFEQVSADGLEIFAGDGIPVVDILYGAVGNRDEAFDHGVVGVDGTRRRQAAGDGGGHHAWQRIEPCGEPAVEGIDAGRVPVGDGGQGEAHGEQVVGIHAGIDFLQLPEGLDHEAGTDQKDQGERQFGGDEEGAEAIGGDGAGGASDSGFQGVVKGRGAHVNDGRQAEGDAGGHTDGQGEEQHLPIDADFGDAGDAAGIGGDQQAESAEGQEDAEDRAGEGEQDAFDDELLKEASQPGADGSADGDFAAAGFGARQQEVGHIDAGDEQNEANRAEEHEHGAADAS